MVSLTAVSKQIKACKVFLGAKWGRIAKNRKVSEGNFIVKKSYNPLRISISGNNKELEENNEIVLTGKGAWVRIPHRSSYSRNPCYDWF